MKRGTVPCFIIIYSALGHLLPHSVKHRLSLTDLCHPYQQNIHSILLPEDLNLGTDVGLVYGISDYSMCHLLCTTINKEACGNLA